jgi:HTH-type transcriptional regulator/antitoxin HigA
MSRAGTSGTKKAAWRADDDYLDLVKRFPIRPIRGKDEHRAAGEILDTLIGRTDLSPGQRDYVAALARFVEDYENNHARQAMEKLTPIEILKHLMEENEMSTTDLGLVLGSRGLASEVLNGKRGLSKMLMGKLSDYFHVDAALFLSVTKDAR